jgi:protein phosphatase
VNNGRFDIGRAAAMGGRAEQQDADMVGVMKAGAYGVVADGMGGRPDGRRCAEFAVANAVDSLARSHHSPNRKRLSGYLMELPATVQTHLALRAAAGELDPAAGATLAAVLLRDRVAWLVTVGDCRCTIVRDGDVYESTVPHNALAVTLRDSPDSLRESERPGLAAAVTRALGPEIGHVPDRSALMAVPLDQGDIVLVTSDGVHEPLGLRGMVSIVSRARADGHSADRLAGLLVATAVEAAPAPGSADNATAVVLIVTEAGDVD